jgi:hypothetical protein
MQEQRLSHRHRVITADDLVFIRRLIAQNPGSSQRDLSKLCQAWNWVQPNGALRDMVCRSMMLKLYREGHIELPLVRCVPRNPPALRAAQSAGAARRGAAGGGGSGAGCECPREYSTHLSRRQQTSPGLTPGRQLS